MSEEERALYELDQTFIQDVTRAQEGRQPTHSSFKHCCGQLRACCCFDKGLLSLVAMLVTAVVGIVVLVLAKWQDADRRVDELGRYIVSAGVFGLASGGTNWLAVVGLFYKIPGFIGSG